LDASGISEPLIDNLRLAQLLPAASTQSLDGLRMSQANSKTKRRIRRAIGCVAVFIVSALFILWYFPGLTFRMVSVADGPNNWSQRWQTILFISVTENMVSYPSEDEARHDFENEIARAETIFERTKQPAGLPMLTNRWSEHLCYRPEDIIPFSGFRRRTFIKYMRRP
jgi:hypothetical protein